MNRINPIYILIILFLLLFLSFIYLGTEKSKLKDIQSNFAHEILTAKDFRILKSNHQDKSNLLSKIKGLKSNTPFRKENIQIINEGKYIKALIKSNNKEVLNKFLNQILQDRFLIKKLTITSNMISFEMEK
ncbi:hypothetical protein CRV02_12785 [Arcobacter sp. CECT 8989]|uniref:hypothetical protein n=1 Tax=Arcobacter sp. CECT 8989 TaxID=2044509 RepID=UPI00100BB5BA|nr:hypothetical protein [Arcobacter sp. CECT 8989]RXJ98921.1 hypothetical protein CRV02_12785 [Arcobacter sp. CECT 8989]